ncbi:hypothetical protein [Cupriavidus pauculus]|uniref:hypothetical protein n=1 Tax=Cupriavidus pauculus TaxID=82633 RepID=UPI0020131985|nr:hypothetical protein [Cupriavidus pauculus]
MVEDDRQGSHVPVHGRTDHPVLQLGRDQGIDAVAINVAHRRAGELAGQPAQALLHGLQRAQVLVLFEPVDDGRLPAHRRALAELLLPPVITRNLGGKFFRLPTVRGASRASNSRTVDTEVDPPGTVFCSFEEVHAACSPYFFRIQSITSTSTSTHALPTFAAGKPWRRMHSETVSGVVNSHAAACSRLSVFTDGLQIACGLDFPPYTETAWSAVRFSEFLCIAPPAFPCQGSLPSVRPMWHCGATTQPSG